MKPDARLRYKRKAYNRYHVCRCQEFAENILDWLDGTDEAGWERQIELGEECGSEMERLARPIYSGARKRSYTFGPERNPDAGHLNRAIPHVRAMLTAMRNRNRCGGFGTW